MAAARRALALEPDRNDALAAISALLIDKGALQEAVALAQGVQRRRPGDAIGFRLEGDALQAQGKHDDALQRYERGFALMRTGPLIISIHRALRAAGKLAAAGARMAQWLDKNPSDSATRLYFASALLQDRHYQAASEQYQRILNSNPDHVLALNDLAWCYLQLSDKRAQAHAERAYKLAPQNPAIADTLGAVLTQQGQAVRAVPLLKKALEQAPAAADIRLHYAQALFRAGDKPGARVQCEQLLAVRDFAQRDEVKALLAQL
jgi:tetratricopeptide (TPR) repeat protein